MRMLTIVVSIIITCRLAVQYEDVDHVGEVGFLGIICDATQKLTKHWLTPGTYK